jgi:hypothetical protein
MKLQLTEQPVVLGLYVGGGWNGWSGESRVDKGLTLDGQETIASLNLQVG